jgi:hypothetical protein
MTEKPKRAGIADQFRRTANGTRARRRSPPAPVLNPPARIDPVAEVAEFLKVNQQTVLNSVSNVSDMTFETD